MRKLWQPGQQDGKKGAWFQGYLNQHLGVRTRQPIFQRSQDGSDVQPRFSTTTFSFY